MKHPHFSTTLATLAFLTVASSLAWPGQGAPAQAGTAGGGAPATPAQGASTPPPQTAPTQNVPTQAIPAPAVAHQTVPAKRGVVKAGAKTPGRKAGKPAPPPKPPWQQFKLDPKATLFLDFTNANPDMVLSIFSRTSGITILKDPSFKIQLTVTSAKSVGLNEAFDILNTVLDMNGYELQKKGNLMIVAKKTPPAPPPMPAMPAPNPANDPEKSVIKVYHLENASAAQVARVVNEVFSQQQLEAIVQQLQQGGGMPPQPQMFGRPGGPQPPKVVRASSDDYSNAVVVNAPQKYQDDVANLIKELDKSSDQPLESEIFKLKYVPVDQAVSAIQDVLNADSPKGRGAAKQDSNQSPFFDYYSYRYGGGNKSSGAQTATAVAQTNSVIVAATKENMEIVRKLVADLDQEASYQGTTSVIHLENAKASDVATLLNQAFTRPKDSQNDNPFFYIYSDSFGDQGNKNKNPTDFDEQGHVVNVKDLTGKVNVIADPNTNSLIVATMPSNMPLIEKIVKRLDQISDQVMIETIIVEANLDKTTKLGAEWSLLQSGAVKSANGSTDFGVQSNTTTPPQGLKLTLGSGDYKVFLNALQSDTRYKVLSTPRIFTSNNVKAEIDVSQQVPYITSQQTSTIGGLLATYDFKTVGVVLTVTPRITSAGQVSMDVVQSADDLQGFTTYNAPIINHRQASTSVTVKDGETVVLGGIIRSTTNLTDNKVPILGDIPLLGNLFKYSVHDHGQTELLVLMTPHIVHNNSEAQRLREEQTGQLSKGSQDELGKLAPPSGGKN